MRRQLSSHFLLKVKSPCVHTVAYAYNIFCSRHSAGTHPLEHLFHRSVRAPWALGCDTFPVSDVPWQALCHQHPLLSVVLTAIHMIHPMAAATSVHHQSCSISWSISSYHPSQLEHSPGQKPHLMTWMTLTWGFGILWGNGRRWKWSSWMARNGLLAICLTHNLSCQMMCCFTLLHLLTFVYIPPEKLLFVMWIGCGLTNMPMNSLLWCAKAIHFCPHPFLSDLTPLFPVTQPTTPHHLLMALLCFRRFSHPLESDSRNVAYAKCPVITGQPVVSELCPSIKLTNNWPTGLCNNIATGVNKENVPLSSSLWYLCDMLDY